MRALHCFHEVELIAMLSSAYQPFSACDPLLLTIFVGSSVRYRDKATIIKVKYEKETKYKQHMQRNVSSGEMPENCNFLKCFAVF